MTILTEDIFKLLLSLALGGLIGAEREMRDKDAGLRTLMFICSGSALFTIFSISVSQAAGLPSDPARIAAQIVTGIGFLGGGVILRQDGQVRGLTTASTIWLVAALGIGVGSGQYLFSSLATLVVLLTLFTFPALERVMGTLTETRTYRVTFPVNRSHYEELTKRFDSLGLVIMTRHRNRRGSDMICTWTVSGRPRNHEAMVDSLFSDPEIIEFEV